MKSVQKILLTIAAMLTVLAVVHVIGYRVCQGGIAPLIVGDRDTDSIYVSFAVNDTLGNAAACDSAWVVRFYNGVAFDSTKLTAEFGSRTGLYAVAFKAARDVDSIGAYWVEVRTYGVSGRSPHATYSYTVLDGGTVGEDVLRGVVADSNLARDVTKADYQSTAGPGPTPVRLLVVNAADTNSIEGVHLTVKLAADQTKKHEAVTGADGWASMTLNLVEYDVYAVANNYTFSTPALNFTVAGDSLRDTIWASQFDPGLPDDPDLCRVYGWIYDLTGQEMGDITVTARITASPVRYQGTVISPYQKATTSDSTGYWFLDVFPSTRLTADSTWYEFTIRYSDGAILRKKVSVPDSTSWLLTW